MTRFRLITFSLFISLWSCVPKVNVIPENDMASTLTYHTNYNVINADDPTVAAIIERWQTYLDSNSHFTFDCPYWHSEELSDPNATLWDLDLRSMKNSNSQNIVIGVVPIEENFWELISMFINPMTEPLTPHYILSIYVTKINDEFKFVSKTDFIKPKLAKQQVGEITYFFDKSYTFNEQEAQKLQDFNAQVASFFKTDILDFEYFICENSRETAAVRGYLFEPSMFVPNQYGALTDVVNRIIYAGNNSEYYPHEVVHLYTKELFNYKYHSWIDEGLATYLGGSRGKDLDWHLEQLKIFLTDNPDFPLNEISELHTISNGNYSTEFRYAIGGLLIREIYKREGLKGIKQSLQFGRKEDDFYRLMKDKFNVEREEFGDLVRSLLLDE